MNKVWLATGYYHPKILKSLRNALSKLPVEIIDPHLTKKTPNKRGKGVKVTSERAYIGYCFLECDPKDSDAIFLAAEKVDGIYWPSLRDKRGYPLPLTEQEIKQIQSLIVEEVVVSSVVEPGDNVTVQDGPFRGMSGMVLSTDEGRGICTIELEVFDRPTQTELSMNSVRKE